MVLRRRVRRGRIGRSRQLCADARRLEAQFISHGRVNGIRCGRLIVLALAITWGLFGARQERTARELRLRVPDTQISSRFSANEGYGPGEHVACDETGEPYHPNLIYWR
ncbi:hypothetical protein A5634_17665 [Mycobacterium asiaticum]|uniref:Uncharacterized protein n=1 Tax=Mycobacterium asiaticum TaxID=1790 RepID=A0A1A3P687_MYCAS|nr:hypothetical protein A5634_17665 [Mycobacterium asiaticum]